MRTYLERLAALVALTLIALMAFTTVGFAAVAVTPGDDTATILDLLKPVADAFAGGHYAFAAALGVIALVALVKKYAGTAVPWLHTDMGGSALALLTASSSALGVSLAAPGAAVTLAMLKSALLVGVGAAGGYAVIKNLLIDPLIKPLMAKAPAWMQPLFQVVMWVFDKPDPVADATKAGDAAVTAAPAGGVAAVTGTPTDVK